MNTTVIDELKRLKNNRLQRRREAFAEVAHLLRTEPLVKPNPHLDKLLRWLDERSSNGD